MAVCNSGNILYPPGAKHKGKPTGTMNIMGGGIFEAKEAE